MNSPHIICFGPGPKFKGGIAQYNTALARALKDEGAQVTIVSWTQQYPAIIPREFVDKASRSDFLEGYDIPVKYLTNWNDPRTWGATAKAIAALKPDKVIIQWYNPTQGIPLNSIANYLRKHCKQTEILFDLHFVAAKEQSSLDARLTRMALRHGHSFIVHAYRTAEELKALMTDRTFDLTLDGKRSGEYRVAGWGGGLGGRGAGRGPPRHSSLTTRYSSFITPSTPSSSPIRRSTRRRGRHSTACGSTSSSSLASFESTRGCITALRPLQSSPNSVMM
jgi:hypothetical protein